MEFVFKDIVVPPKVQESWQEIADLLAEVAAIPAALIMRLSHPYIEVFVVSRTEGNPYKPGDKEVFDDSGLYCETVIRTKKKLKVPNALKDEKWKENPDIKLNMISYMGFPLLFPDETPFGTLCILDSRENAYSPTTEKLMLKFKALIEDHLELLYVNRQLGDNNKKLSDYLEEIQILRGIVTICSHCKDIRDEEGNWHPVEKYLLKTTQAEFSHSVCPKCLEKYYPDRKEGKKDK